LPDAKRASHCRVTFRVNGKDDPLAKRFSLVEMVGLEKLLVGCILQLRHCNAHAGRKNRHPLGSDTFFAELKKRPGRELAKKAGTEALLLSKV